MDIGCYMVSTLAGTPKARGTSSGTPMRIVFSKTMATEQAITFLGFHPYEEVVFLND